MNGITRDTPAGMTQRPAARALLTLALLALGLAGNVLNVPLVYGVNFIFGSIATLLALSLLGRGGALVVALGGGLYTLLLWGHAYALLILLAEAASVSWLMRRGWRNLVLADLGFWLVLGLPLVLLTYRGMLGMEWLPATLVALKQALNGVFNALVASLAVVALQLSRRRSAQLPAPRLADMLFSTLLAATLLAGSVPVILHSHEQRAQQETFLLERMRDLGESLMFRAGDAGPELLPLVWGALMEAEQVGPALGLALLDEHGSLLVSRGQVSSLRPETGRLTTLGDGLSIWMPDGTMAAMTRWAQGRYRTDLTVERLAPGGRLVVERSAKPLVQVLEAQTLQVFLLLSGLLLLGIAGSFALSHWLSRPLALLEAASSGLSAQIARGQEPALPDSPVQEYSRLSGTLRDMSVRLATSFRELHEVQADLERQVLVRTAELNQVKSTLDQTLDGVLMFDAASLCLFYANEGALRLSGRRREAVLGLPAFELHDGFDEAGFRALIEPLRSGTQDTLTLETHWRKSSGERVPVQLFLQHVAPPGEMERFVCLAHDITERQRIDRMKSEFVSTVSHELRTPLTSISGALGLINGGALGELPAKARQMIGIAHKNSQRLSLLINDLLDMERLTAGKLNFDIRLQAIEPLVEQSVDAIQSYGAQRHVRVAQMARCVGCMVRVDGQRLMQVLANLLSNAVKFSPEQGLVEVRVEAVRDRVRITVSDRGPGIPAAFRDRVFEKFAQADASDTRKLGGSGLGLAITKELIERMGGSIGFESVEGQGASFHVELPAEAQQQGGGGAARDQAAGTQP